MCLGTPLTESGTRKRIKRYTKNGYVRLYKVARLLPAGFWPAVVCGQLPAGLGVAEEKAGWWEPDVGFHAFFRVNDAREWALSSQILLEVLILPRWIKDCGTTDDKWQTCACTKMFFPTFPDTKARVKDFRAALKKEQ